MTLRRLLLIFSLAVVLGVPLALLALAWSYEEGDNYTRIDTCLYLGGRVEEPPPGTRVVINLCRQKDPYLADLHVWEPIADSAPAPSLDWLPRLVDFLDGRQRAGVTTFVHCRNGVSRSALVVVAYYMRRNGWTRDEALAFVRTRRPIVRPNPAFMELLAEWEKELNPPRSP